MIDDAQIREIVERNRFVWEDQLTLDILHKWLNNFTGDAAELEQEQKVALNLMNNFMLYSEKEIKYLCKAALSIIKREIIRKKVARGIAVSAENIKQEITDNYRFSYVGEAGESGAHLLYQFRQENKLLNEHCKEPSKFLLEPCNDALLPDANLIFIDDFLGTGRTACKFWDSTIVQISAKYPRIKMNFLALVTTTRAIQEIKDYTGLNVLSPQVLDCHYKVFSEDSMVFPSNEDRETAKRICELYGCKLVRRAHALGYENSQALLGFHHNIPDNTLPVIWSEKVQTNGKKWSPLFKRYSKF